MQLLLGLGMVLKALFIVCCQTLPSFLEQENYPIA